MAEAAGLAAGVISLGLQVTQYIVNYVGAIRGRQDDLVSAKSYAADLDQILRAYEQLLTRGRAESLPQSSMNSLETCMKSCEPELTALNALLADIAGSASSDPSFKEKLISRARNLSYPFRKGHLEDLQGKMSRVVTTLQAGAQAVGIAAQQGMSAQLQIVSQQTDAVRSDVAALGTPIESIQAGISETQSLLQHMVVQRGDHAVTTTTERQLVETTPVPRRTVIPTTPYLSLDSVCTCPRTRRRSRRAVPWGPLWTYSDTSTLSYHLPNCPVRLERRDETSGTFGVAFTGMASWLKGVVELSFSQNQAARGFAISPSITYRATVDAQTSPAFRILNIAENAIYGRVASYGRDVMIDICRRKLLALFMSGKARATDVDSRNRSLMHYAIKTLAWLSFSSTGMIPDSAPAKQLVALLLDVGVSPDSQDINGMTPFFVGYRVAYDAWPVGREFPEFAPGAGGRVSDNVWSISRFIQGAAKSMAFAEAWGCGPLSIAILAKDYARVRELVERDKSVLTENNDLGLPVILLAAYNFPRSIPFLISAAKDFAPLYDISHGLSSAIHLALIGSEEHEPGPHSDNCTGTSQEEQCHSGTAVTALCRSQEWKVDNHYLEGACHHCRIAVVSEMASEREYLKDLAFRILPPHNLNDIDRNSVLDVESHRIRELVRQAGVVHPILLTRISHYKRPSQVKASVYNYLNDVETAELFYRQGFRDTDHLISIFGSIPGGGVRFEYVCWLFEHSSTPRKSVRLLYFGRGNPFLQYKIPFARFMSESMGSHMLWWGSGTAFSSWQERLEVYRQGIDGLIPYDVRDRCRCECSFRMGCGLVSHVLRECIYKWPGLSTDLLDSFLVSITLVCGEFFDRNEIRNLIRLVTFQKLDMTHTCCLNYGFAHLAFDESANDQDYTDDEDDIREIWGEEQRLISELDNLTLDFENKLRLSDDHLVLDSEEIEDFWTIYWPQRLQETTDILNGKDITEDERTGAEDIGVVWGMKSEEKEKPRRMETLQDFEEALDAAIAGKPDCLYI